MLYFNIFYAKWNYLLNLIEDILKYDQGIEIILIGNRIIDIKSVLQIEQKWKKYSKSQLLVPMAVCTELQTIKFTNL